MDALAIGTPAVGRGWASCEVGTVLEIRRETEVSPRQVRLNDGPPERWWWEEDVFVFATAEEAKAFADDVRKLKARASRH